MTRALLALAILFSTPAFAQQLQQQQDPQIAIYRQLLDQANAQMVQLAVQLQAAQEKIKELEAKQPDKK